MFGGGTHPGREAVRRIDAADVGALREGLRGELILPDDDAYPDARRLWNGRIDRHPALIVRCAGAADVVTAVDFARDHGMPLSVRGGGHSVTGASVVDAGLVVDCSTMKSVQVDPESRTVRVEPGVRIGELLKETMSFGLAAPTGTASDTGVAGSSLGGGIGWLRRKHGLGVDNLRSVDVVTADGTFRRASEERNEDLFWALRGGGANFGAVTAYEFDLHPLESELMTLDVVYPDEHARAAVDAYREFAADAPEEATLLAFAGTVPAMPTYPAEHHGEPAFSFLGCYAGPTERGREVFEPLREVAEPILDSSGPMPYTALHELISSFFPTGGNYYWRSAFFDELDDRVVDRIFDHVASAPTPQSEITIWNLGGEMSRIAPDATAFPWRNDAYLVSIEAIWEDRIPDEVPIEWALDVDAALREVGGEGSYAGFTGTGPEDEDTARLVYGENYDMLVELKREYDPSNLFRGHIDPMH